MIERSPEIEQQMREAAAEMQQMDVDRVMKRMSSHPCVVMIGSAAEEWFKGRDQIERVMRGGGVPDADPTEMPRSSLDEIEAYRDGDVGWATAHGTWTIGDTSVPFRMTAVLHLEDGLWRGVQNHVSIGVPNDEMTNPIFQAAGATAG